MIFSTERIGLFFGVAGLSLLGCFLISPWREKQFEDYAAISSDPVQLGQVACFQKATGEFTLTNLSSDRIPFTINADCSCTSLETTSGILEPRSKHLVKFSYSPKSVAVIESSIRPEESDITVSLLAKGNRFSKLVAVRAEGVFPLMIDSFSLTASVEPLRVSEVVVPFSVAKDVKHVRLVSAPDFLKGSRVSGAIGTIDFLASIEMPSGTHLGPVVLEFDVKNVAEPVRIDLPIAVIVEKPYSFSSDVLSLSPNNSTRMEVRPRFGAMFSEFIKVETDCELLTTIIRGDSVTISCASSSNVLLPITGRLRTSIRSRYSDGREVTTDDDLPFTVSEGGIFDE
ncbi:MAG: hypothetical protein NTY42_06085 [Planctomycetota bacterium]|jgi:hypothetical protein|nr:hypothetical protein [Planctomycetota bacterium]